MTEPAIDGGLLDELQQELADRGRDDAITAAELADRVEIGDRDGSPKTREAITALLFERSVPIRSGSVGYWICQSEAEAEEYRADLEGRIEGIEQRLVAFETAWREWSTNTELSREEREKIEADPFLSMDDFSADDLRERAVADGGETA
ncbi:hypothetical protein D3D02_13210 [Halobellus sp. Atlit-38R]|uniref:hypothetical protein n=1 Tax=Halobellus sp. Atlit-38R TaxID=2282131 RepID=UPI000EF1CD08|nr:hypothetical protein [Halobellus sp. Atlit-38R]RLM88164.1 hypothetical protein D3D02_13210 [Halobellus sp. Atlit-38R]